MALCSSMLSFETRFSKFVDLGSAWALLGLWLLDLRSKAFESPTNTVLLAKMAKDIRFRPCFGAFRSVSERFSAEELVSSKWWLDLEGFYGTIFAWHGAWKTEHCDFIIGLPALDFEGVLSRRACCAKPKCTKPILENVI